MTGQTARFAFPLLEPGQAQKELYHNEALALLDAVVQPVAQTIGDDAPPAAPAPDQSWIVGAAPTGDWAGHADAFATWTDGGWRFVAAVEGMTAWVVAGNLPARFVGGAWAVGRVTATALIVDGHQVVGAAQPPIEDPVGGGVADEAARASIRDILAALRNHGLIAA
ncbi:DUF2793 domain-containing protein [Sphingomonas nostoxanthinifaciens]|uniref:DUF2793 domain-containing protein n=1 Tax=Sphingomonas nostoxanthinifaciens TaxID=2872652 RepID=UPI001CC1D5FD|nr:DUF2793 domain-containing protein [Sphingomonas nostoxanthinifaciens]UAK23998.1 DUF2793 domain-containing protein [Sphingomonas nostoxanthinifaciens]